MYDNDEDDEAAKRGASMMNRSNMRGPTMGAAPAAGGGMGGGMGGGEGRAYGGGAPMMHGGMRPGGQQEWGGMRPGGQHEWGGMQPGGMQRGGINWDAVMSRIRQNIAARSPFMGAQGAPAQGAPVQGAPMGTPQGDERMRRIAALFGSPRPQPGGIVGPTGQM